jgi:hypothetical protein
MKGPITTNVVFVLASTAVLASSLVARPARAAGTWTVAPSNAVNGGPAFGLWLLTDGTVLSHGNALNHWVILTPDKTGSYANGTWKSVADSNFARGGAQEHVLKDGRFFEAGGEYLYAWPAVDGVAACASSCTNPAGGSPLYKNVEIYDPVTNTWTVEASGLYDIGDTGSATLSDGRILDSTRVSNQIQIYDPVANAWTAGASSPTPNGDENAWASLQNGGVLAVAPMATAIYNPAANTWVKTGPLPAGFAVTLTTTYPGTYDFGDTAGISQMFDGRVLAYGLGRTAIYTPGPTASDPGTWALGPNMLYKTGPNNGTPGNDAEDEYTVTEPNGKVMIATYPFGGSPDTLQEYDPTTNTMTAITPPPDGQSPYPVSYLNLPNGQVMVTCGSRDWLYTPDSAPQDSWRPAVTSVAFDSGSTYTLTGTQLSGLINGGDEGDDMTMAENYPIVWLEDATGDVYFAKSFNFSTMMPQVGNAPQTCQFTTPPGLPSGSYSLYVSSAGVQSKTAFAFTTGMSSTASSTSSTGTASASTGTSSTGSTGSMGAGTGASTTGAGTSGHGSGTSASAVGSTGPGGETSTGASSGAANDVRKSPGCGCATVGLESGTRGAAGLVSLAGLASLGLRRRRKPTAPAA